MTEEQPTHAKLVATDAMVEAALRSWHLIWVAHFHIVHSFSMREAINAALALETKP